jgi:ribosomal 50S subunit-recycling heat shock protein
LKTSRLVKRRAIAKELCDEGAVSVNGRPSRAGRELVPGDEVTLNLRDRIVSVAVSEIPPGPKGGASRTQNLYKLIRDERRGSEEHDPQGAE